MIFFKRVLRGKIIIILNIPDQIDTTEVGIFWYKKEDIVSIKIVSLSSQAKRKVKDIIIEEIENRCYIKG